MFKISIHSFEALEQASSRRFEDRVALGFREAFPRHWSILGREPLLDAARLGISLARKHGFDSERDVASYVHLMVILGAGFDRDIQLPWASAVLNDDSTKVPSRKIARLHERATDYWNRTAGRDQINLMRAFARVKVAPLDQLTPDQARTEADAIDALERLYPEKARVIGRDVLLCLLRESRVAAVEHSLHSRRDAMIFTVARFLLGAGFDRDPLLPWAKAALADPNPTRRGDRLHQAAMEQIAIWST